MQSSKQLYRGVTLGDVVDKLSAADDPDHILAKIGKTRTDLRALEGDDEIAQCLETRESALATSPWRLEVGGSTEQIRDWVKETLKPHYISLTKAIWGAVPYGYSVVRPVYSKPTEGIGVIDGLESIEVMPFEYYRPNGVGQWSTQTDVLGEWRMLSASDIKYLHFITVRKPSVRNRYGSALLSRAYWAWFFRYNGWTFWMQYLERFGSPMLIGKGNDPSKMVETLLAAVQDAVIAVGMDEEVTALSSNGNGEPFNMAEERLLRRIQKLILGQTLTSEVSAKGSFAAADIHNQVRLDKRKDDIELVKPTVQRIVDSLTHLRFGESAVPPVFDIDDDTGIQLPRAERDAVLKNSGIVKQFSEDYVLRVFDYNKGEIEIGDAEEVEPVVPAKNDS